MANHLKRRNFSGLSGLLSCLGLLVSVIFAAAGFAAIFFTGTDRADFFFGFITEFAAGYLLISVLKIEVFDWMQEC